MKKTKRRTSTRKKPQPKVFLWAGLGIATAGVAGYFGWRHYQMRNSAVNIEPILLPETSVNPVIPYPGGNKSKGDSFPLRQGSQGARVGQLQNALINRYGTSILPKYGADSIWGDETQKALISKGLPTLLDEAAFNQVVTGSKTGSGTAFNPQTVAGALADSIIQKNYSRAMQTLSQLRSVSDYSAVNTWFKERRIFGVRHTLVTALLKFFPANKTQISQELSRIGLKYNGSQWSLSGLGALQGPAIRTIRPTAIWNGDNITVEVPADMILGSELASENGFTRFITKDHKILHVRTNAIRYA
jgi:hypothetical protein